jgi:hypothetical protein
MDSGFYKFGFKNTFFTRYFNMGGIQNKPEALHGHMLRLNRLFIQEVKE